MLVFKNSIVEINSSQTPKLGAIILQSKTLRGVFHNLVRTPDIYALLHLM